METNNIKYIILTNKKYCTTEVHDGILQDELGAASSPLADSWGVGERRQQPRLVHLALSGIRNVREIKPQTVCPSRVRSGGQPGLGEGWVGDTWVALCDMHSPSRLPSLSLTFGKGNHATPAHAHPLPRLR